MKRWPIIRHVRWLVSAWLLGRYWEGFARYHWLTVSPADLQYLEDVWKGKA